MSRDSPLVSHMQKVATSPPVIARTTDAAAALAQVQWQRESNRKLSAALQANADSFPGGTRCDQTNLQSRAVCLVYRPCSSNWL